MVVATLDELYFHWLYEKVASLRFTNPTRTYKSLTKQLYAKEFIWWVPNDDNRVEDGRDLRREFLEEKEIEIVDPNWMDDGCSMFEMIWAVCGDLAFESNDGKTPRQWFWTLMENLDLRHFTDAYYEDHGVEKIQDVVDETLDRVIFRIYDHAGKGGLFPLQHPKCDQREVELWYQLNYYLLEREG